MQFIGVPRGYLVLNFFLGINTEKKSLTNRSQKAMLRFLIYFKEKKFEKSITGLF